MLVAYSGVLRLAAWPHLRHTHVNGLAAVFFWRLCRMCTARLSGLATLFFWRLGRMCAANVSGGLVNVFVWRLGRMCTSP